MKKFLKNIAIGVNLIMSGLGITAPPKLHKSQQNREDAQTYIAIDNASISDEEIVTETKRLTNLRQRNDELEVYKAYGLPLVKGSIKLNYSVDKDENGCNTGAFEVKSRNDTLEVIKELTDKEKKEVERMKKYDG